MNSSRTISTSYQEILKSPFSLLQEICAKTGLELKYEERLLKFQGDLVYEAIIEIDDLLTNMFGITKRNAKHCAAFDILNQIKSKLVDNDELRAEIESTEDYMKSFKIEEYKVKKNSDLQNVEIFNDCIQSSTQDAIGALITLARHMSKPDPRISFGSAYGPPHNRTFECYIAFDVYEQIGKGRTKQMAKQNAAQLILNKIKQAQNANNNNNNSNTHKSIDVFVKKAGFIKDTKSSFQKLIESNGRVIKNLLTSPHFFEETNNFTEFLELLSKEQNFSIDVNMLSAKPCQILIELNTTPKFVVAGDGKIQKDAFENASYNALKYIKLICMKKLNS